MVKARRVIRPRGSENAYAIGKVYHFDSLSSLGSWTRKQHKVYAYMITDIRSQGIMRSGRAMRWCDLNVRNILDSRLFQVEGEPIVKG